MLLLIWLVRMKRAIWGIRISSSNFILDIIWNQNTKFPFCILILIYILLLYHRRYLQLIQYWVIPLTPYRAYLFHLFSQSLPSLTFLILTYSALMRRISFMTSSNFDNGWIFHLHSDLFQLLSQPWNAIVL